MLSQEEHTLHVVGPFGCQWTTETREDGTFRIGGLPDGRYELEALLRQESGLRTFKAKDLVPGARDVVLGER